MRKPNLSPLGPAATFFRDLDDFSRVLCPACGHEFACENIKMFGILGRALFWVPLAVVLVAVLVMWGYLSGPR